MKIKKNIFPCIFKLSTAFFILISFSKDLVADDLMLTLGGGAQPDSNQENKTMGLDFNFFEYKRSAKQSLNIGVSYTLLQTNLNSCTLVQINNASVSELNAAYWKNFYFRNQDKYKFTYKDSTGVVVEKND